MKTHSTPDVFSNKTATMLDDEDMLKFLLYLGRCTSYPDAPGGPSEAHFLPFMEITVHEFRTVQEELAEGTHAYAKWQQIHPTDPNRGTPIPNYDRGYADSLETQYSIDYFRTQPV